MLKKLFISGLLFMLSFAMAGKALADVAAELERAETYRTQGQYEQAEQIYQQIVRDYPGTDYAFTAQKELTFLYIAWNKWPQAESAYQQLLAGFSGHKDIAQAVHDIAYQYRLLQKYDKANQLDQYVVDNWPQSDYAVLAQMDLAKYYVNQGNDTAAEAAVDKLLVNFSQNPLIARALHDVGQHYRWSGKYEKANELYQDVIDNWPDSEHALWSQADLIKSNIALGDDVAAQAAIDKLVTNFTDNPLTARAVWDTGQYYRGLKKYKKANELYQHVIDNWPKTEHALWSQADLIKSNIALGDDTAAEAAVDKLLADFTDNPLIARAVWDTGQYYRELKKYQKANQLYQHVVDNWPDTEHALWSQADLIKSYLALGDDPNAQTAVEKLLTDFSGNKYKPRAIHDTAYQYRKLQKYDKANQLDQYVIDNWPQDEQTMWAKMDMAKTNIVLGNDSAAQEALDTLIADFNDHPALPEVVFVIGEQYYNKAFIYKKEGPDTKVEDCFRKALAIWESITELPPNAVYPAQAYLFSGECYNRLGQLQTAIEYYQIVVDDWPDYENRWYALFLIGCGYEQLRDSGDVEKSLAKARIQAAYEQVLLEYPGCPAAKAADNWLKCYVKSSQGGQK